MLTSIKVASLSANSLNVMSQTKEMMSNKSWSSYLNSFIQSQDGSTYTLSMSLNSLQSEFEFADMFTIFDVILPS